MSEDIWYTMQDINIIEYTQILSRYSKRMQNLQGNTKNLSREWTLAVLKSLAEQSDCSHRLNLNKLTACFLLYCICNGNMDVFSVCSIALIPGRASQISKAENSLQHIMQS